MMWRYLNTPDANRDDWYGELTNQLSHTLLGAAAAQLFCDIWFLVAGEMPVRSWVLVALFLAYGAGIEAAVQRWMPGDAWFDTLMFMFGAAFTLLPLTETGISGMTVHLDYDPMTRLSLFAAWSIILFARVWRRYDANGRQA